MAAPDQPAHLLLCDIGNTSLKLGVADAVCLRAAYVLPTDTGQTADSLGLTLLALLRHAGVPAGGVAACVCASVAPVLTPLLRAACARFVRCPFWRVPEDIPVPLENGYARPEEVGADRLLGAWAARQVWPVAEAPAAGEAAPSLIVVDFGTATTFDCVRGNAYLGGLIFPGVHMAARALSLHTAQLPHVSLETGIPGFVAEFPPEPVPGRDTASSIRHGIVFGYACLVEGLTARLARQLPPPVKVLATGGFARELSRITSCFDKVLPDLLLEGLRQLYLAWSRP